MKNALVAYLAERPEFKTAAVVDNQWGDTGKGKIVAALSSWADIIVRGTGGANAGHTIYQDDKRYVLHIVPCGILTHGKINVIGRGVAVDPAVLLEDLTQVEHPSRLLISKDAHLVLPQHILLDCVRENSAAGKIGTTGRGIGPCYEDHLARIGLKVMDLLNPDVLRTKLERNLERRRAELSQKDALPKLRSLLLSDQFAHGNLWDRNSATVLNVHWIVEHYSKYGQKLKDMIINADTYLQERVGKARILLEGAQGLLLSVDYGTYPYVTSCDCSRYGLARGAGLLPEQVDFTLGTVKAFAMTRVGKGAFPTELGGEKSEEWCNLGITEQDEQKQCPAADINSDDPFEQGVAVRRAGGEYGSTTGRPRRVGWLDLPLLRHAVSINGPQIVLTKLDMLSECESINICDAYRYSGPSQYVCHSQFGEGPVLSQSGKLLQKAIVADEVLRHCAPQYRKFPGWQCDISGITNQDDLPRELRDLTRFVEDQTGANVIAGSVGPANDQLFMMSSPALVRA